MHVPVLVAEVLHYLDAEHGQVFIDGTAGSGGHIKAIAAANPQAKILGLDADGDNLEILGRQLAGLKNRVTLVHANYAGLDQVAKAQGLSQVSGILLDLGFSSMQLDDPARGLSFQEPGPLDMRFDRSQSLTAGEIVNTYPETKLVEIFSKYGEENFSKRIAREIVVRRKGAPLADTGQVFHLIKQVVPGYAKHKANDSARRVFQALRIAVNGELDNLEQVLPQAMDLLAPGGRLVVISFHSLEDRIVKNYFHKLAYPCVCPPEFPECVCGKKPTAKILTKKPVTAGAAEIADNSRAKPAKLRAAEKL